MREAAVPVRVTLDRDVNAAYIYLADEPAEGWRHGKTVPIDVTEIPGMVNIDPDDDGRLIGIEVLAAASLLPDKMLNALDHAER
jgi:uncharacterized protein YuzE